MSDLHMSNLTQMQNTGKDIAAVFAGALDRDKVTSMTQELLQMIESIDPESCDSRMMLLGALAALGQEATAPSFADIGGAHESSVAEGHDHTKINNAYE